MMRRFLLAALCLILSAAPALAADSKKYTLNVDGRDRNYLLYRPANIDPQKPTPLVIMLHGGFGTAEHAERAYHWDEEAAHSGFTVAYPNGARHSWNAGGTCCGRGAKDHIDDVHFVTEVILDVSKRVAIDPHRVYLTGMSNGAALSYHYACEGEYAIAAIGAVAGSMSYDCPAPHAVSVMEIHGAQDRNIPMNGGLGPKAFAKVDWMPVENVIGKFRHASGCPAPTEGDKGPVHIEQSLCPVGREVTLITIDGAGHQWPGGKPHGLVGAAVLDLDPPSKAIDATQTLWHFFAQHEAH